MAHSKQSAKRNRTNLKAQERNKRQRSAMKTAVKRVVNAETPDAARANLAEAMKKLDKAAKKRVIHPNAASRQKSRLARRAAAATR
jgi:small subunit ribosomal protein S20